jgi:hypothetical protein
MAQLSAIKAMFHNDIKVLERLDRIEAMHVSTENVISDLCNVLKSIEKGLHGGGITQSHSEMLNLDSEEDSSRISREEARLCSIMGMGRGDCEKKRKCGKIKQQNDQTSNDSRHSNMSAQGRENDACENKHGGEEKSIKCTTSNLVHGSSSSDCIGISAEESVRKSRIIGFCDSASHSGEQLSVGQPGCVEQKTNGCIPTCPDKIEINTIQSAEFMEGITLQEPISKPEADDIHSTKDDSPFQHQICSFEQDTVPLSSFASANSFQSNT